MKTLAPLLLALFALASPAAAQDDDPGFKPPAVIAGRFLLPDGSPAVGVAVRVHGWVANQERILEFGHPKGWSDPEGTTDAQGRVRLQLVPPRAYQFTVDADLDGFAQASWRWSGIAMGETKDLGDVTLVAAGTIVGRVVDRDGNVLTKGWSISAEQSAVRRGGRDETRARGAVDPATGEFRIERVPAGRVVVDGRAGGGVHTNEVTVDVVAGVENVVELVYDGPNLDRRITVVHFSRPFYTYEPASASITLIAPDGTKRTAVHVAGSSQSEAFDDVDDGEYRVEIDDPLYEFWSQDGVQPGERVNARLKGAATLKVEVVDADTGSVVPRYGLRVVFHRSSSFPNEFELLPDDGTPPEGGAFEGILPTPQTLVVRAPGRPPTSVVVDGLERGETRLVRIAVSRGTGLAGRVLDATAAPLPDLAVEWTRGDRAGYAGPGRRSDSSGRVPNVERTLRTDPEGRFQLADVAAGTHTFRVRISPWLVIDRTLDLPLAAGEQLELHVPPSNWLEGKLLIPAGASIEGLSLGLHGASLAEPDVDPFARRLGAGQAIQPDGTFRYGPLPLGDVNVSADFVVPLGSSSWTTRSQELGRVTITAASATTATWDLRDRFPGSARIRIRVDGDDFSGRIGLLQDGKGGSGASEPDPAGYHVRSGLEPGTWTLVVYGDGWQWTCPDELEIASAREVTFDTTLELVERTVRFVDAGTGAPLAATSVECWTGERGFRSSNKVAETGDDGRAELRLPPGPVRFCLPATVEDPDPRRRSQRRESESSVEHVWSAGGEVLEVHLSTGE